VVVAVRENQLIALGRARVADPLNDRVEGGRAKRRITMVASEIMASW
jgi:hypothetical protein